MAATAAALGVDGALPASLFDPSATWSYSKVSCLRGAFMAHIVFCQLLFCSGVLCMVTRAVGRFSWLHVWFGRLYIISMLWATATSLLIHNTGLPAPTLISFVWALGGLCVAWLLIKWHEQQMDRLAAAALRDKLAAPGAVVPGDLVAALRAEKARIAAGKGFAARLFSIKALHGAIMFTSWVNIAGRIFASNQDPNHFACSTYPVYKPITTPAHDGANKPLELVPGFDPNYDRLPWAKLGLAGWGAAMALGPLAGAALVGALWSAIAARRARRGAAVGHPSSAVVAVPAAAAANNGKGGHYSSG